MVKKLNLLMVIICLITINIKAQTINLVNGNLLYTIDTISGEIKNINLELIGKIDETGGIYNELQTQIAYFSQNNELITEQGVSLGKLNEDGSVQFNNGVRIGFIQDDGVVLGLNQNIIGSGNNVSKKILMYLFFFYPL